MAAQTAVTTARIRGRGRLTLPAEVSADLLGRAIESW